MTGVLLLCDLPSRLDDAGGLIPLVLESEGGKQLPALVPDLRMYWNGGKSFKNFCNVSVILKSKITFKTR